MKAKHQRLTLALLAVGAVGGASALALSALKDQAAFFYAPGDVKKDGLPLGRAVRLGGMVAAGSISAAGRRRDDALRRDRRRSRRCRSRSAASRPICSARNPAWSRKDRSIPDGSFTATNLLAKHDEKYMPPEIAGKMHETKTLKR